MENMNMRKERIRIPRDISPLDADKFAGDGLAGKLEYFSFGFEKKGALFIKLPDGNTLYYMLGLRRSVYMLLASEEMLQQGGYEAADNYPLSEMLKKVGYLPGEYGLLHL